jgi:hypothetical protein
MSYQLQSNAMPSKILYVDSRDASIYLGNNTSYFQYELREKIEVPLNQRVLISLNSATIPYSFYNIRTDINNKLKIQLENTTLVTTDDFELQIDAGNYDVYSLSTFIENFINNTVLVGTNVTIVIDYNNDKQKYIYNLSKTDDTIPNDEYILKFRFDDIVITQTPHIEMGFNQNSLMTILIPSSIEGVASTGQLNSTNVVDVNGSIHGIYVRTNLVSNGTLDTQSGTFSNILSRIPINVNSGGVIFATPNNATHRSIVDLRTIDILTIRLTDERNRILDLNGLDFQIAISIDFLYAERKITLPMGSLNESNFGFSHIDDKKENNKKENNKKDTKIKNSRK